MKLSVVMQSSFMTAWVVFVAVVGVGLVFGMLPCFAFLSRAKSEYAVLPRDKKTDVSAARAKVPFPCVAVLHWGLLRGAAKCVQSQYKFVFEPLMQRGYTVVKFLHTWDAKTDLVSTMDEREGFAPKKVFGISEVLFNPPINVSSANDSPEEFVHSLDFRKFFRPGDKGGEWLPNLIRGHLLALESLRRVVNGLFVVGTCS